MTMSDDTVRLPQDATPESLGEAIDVASIDVASIDVASIDVASIDAASIFELVVRGERGPRLPFATYRVQLNRSFTFEDAHALVDYLDELGVTELYASPFFKARCGSMHGYDLVDHNALNPEIGTREELEALSDELRRRGMGILLDFVPNHMGIGSGENEWWMDVLENGPGSLYAPFFDIDWSPLKRELEGKVLLPILGDLYGRVLENGELVLSYEAGAVTLHYYATPLPINPRTYTRILGALLPPLIASLGEEHDAVLELQSIITGLGHLPSQRETQRAKVIERRREKEILKRRLSALCESSREVAAALEARLGEMNGNKGDPRSFDELDLLLGEQAYRLSYWRVAAEEINYRRFFDINDLAAIRVERPSVFAETHRLLFELVNEGRVTGLRIDHSDGLWDPVSYLSRLSRVIFLERIRRELARPEHGELRDAERMAFEAASMQLFDRENEAQPDSPLRPFYIVVEKILTRGEELPRGWATYGTSGYDFANLVHGLFVAGSREREMTELYERFVAQRFEFPALMYEKKKLILQTSLASELNVLAHALNRISERDRHTRDFTIGTLTHVLREVIASFPVYRTYVREETMVVAPRDRAVVGVAVRLARRRNPATDASAFAFVRSVLLLEPPSTAAPPDRTLYREFVMRFQQLTGPVMAKGLEDTTFYIYNRLVSLNEVGGEPERYGIGMEEFHEANEERQRLWPFSLLATSTHDTKRSEDVRARISVLSELMPAWAEALEAMARAAASFKTEIEEFPAPDANEEYLFYQTLLGTWPVGAVEASATYVERLVEYMRKAAKEAKVNTSWITAEPEYDAALERFVRGVLGDSSEARAFREALLPLARVVAFHGMWGSLSQALFKFMAPGVPDLYQGTEIWDDSLVDPDNRRPVDFVLRRRMLSEIKAKRSDGAPFLRELLASATDGRIKLFVTHTALELRRRFPELFGAEGSYTPLYAEGAHREHVVAFARSCGGRRVVVAGPRLVATLMGSRELPPVGSVWEGTSLELPEGHYEDLLARRSLTLRGSEGNGRLALAELFEHFPVALLLAEGESRGSMA